MVSKRGWMVAAALLGGVGALLISAWVRWDHEDVPAECRGHHSGDSGAPADDSQWLFRRAAASAEPMGEDFRSESRDPTWAPAMEAEIRRLVSPVLSRIEGASLAGLCCHRTGCRMVVRVT